MAELDLTQMRIDIDKEMAKFNIDETDETIGHIHFDSVDSDGDISAGGMMYVDGEDKVPVQREIIAGKGITIAEDTRTVSAEIGESDLDWVYTKMKPFMAYDNYTNGLVAAHSDNPAWKGVIGTNALVTEKYLRDLNFLSEEDVVKLIDKYATQIYGSCGWYSNIPSGASEYQITVPTTGSRAVWTLGRSSAEVRSVGVTLEDTTDGIAGFAYSTGEITLPRPGTYTIRINGLFVPSTGKEGRVEFHLDKYNAANAQWENHFTSNAWVDGNTTLAIDAIVDSDEFASAGNVQQLKFRASTRSDNEGLKARINFDSCNIIVNRIA